MNEQRLSPMWIRLAAFAAMTVIAIASIWLIDRRAMMSHAAPGPTTTLTP